MATGYFKRYNFSPAPEMGDRLATINIGRKLGTVPFFVGGAGSQ